MEESIIVCAKEYRLIQLLGHGKGGYACLAVREGQKVVVKQIHHEPYYTQQRNNLAVFFIIAEKRVQVNKSVKDSRVDTGERTLPTC